MSLKNIVVTPSGQTAIAMSEITGGELIMQDTLEPWQADGNKFATAMVAASAIRGVTIAGGNVAQLLSLPRGTVCVITGKLYDATNGAGPGCLNVTLANAVLGESPFSAPTNKFATGSASFMAFSSDGTTDPLSFTTTPVS